MNKLRYPLTIFYDGNCQMCIRQTAKFRKLDKKKRLIFVDISSAEFKEKNFGIDPTMAQKYIFAKDSNGRIVRGIDAFIWMWQAIDYFFLPGIVGLPGIKQIGKFLYRVVSRLRYLFGKNKNTCDFHCDKKLIL